MRTEDFLLLVRFVYFDLPIAINDVQDWAYLCTSKELYVCVHLTCLIVVPKCHSVKLSVINTEVKRSIFLCHQNGGLCPLCLGSLDYIHCKYSVDSWLFGVTSFCHAWFRIECNRRILGCFNSMRCLKVDIRPICPSHTVVNSSSMFTNLWQYLAYY